MLSYVFIDTDGNSAASDEFCSLHLVPSAEDKKAPPPPPFKICDDMQKLETVF